MNDTMDKNTPKDIWINFLVKTKNMKENRVPMFKRVGKASIQKMKDEED